MSEHVEHRLAAFLDGEVSETESAAVRAHVETCPRCARALHEARRVVTAMEGDEDSEPLVSMWAGVESRLRRRLPVFDLPFATATAAALAAGIMLGVLTFERDVQDVTSLAEVATTADTWAIESELLLSDIYLSDPGDEVDPQ